MKKFAVIITVVIASIVLFGCSSHPTVKPQETSQSVAPEVRTSYHFGDTVKYDDGLQFTVAAPKEFEASYTAEGKAVYFNVVVTNNSDQPFELVADERAKSGGEESEFIADSYNDMTGAPGGILQPGESVSWKTAFDVKDVSDITYLITIDDYKRDAVEFTK